MNTYATLLDYLGEQRPPERMTIPPGGTVGAADPYLVDIAVTVRTIPSKLARISFLRNEGALLTRLNLPGLSGHEAQITARINEWCDELQLVADNSNSGGRLARRG